MNFKTLPPAEYRPLMEDACYHMMREKGSTAFGLFLHRVKVQASNMTVPGHIASIGTDESGQFNLFLHWPTMKSMPKDAFREILKHEILHPVHGHVGPRWKNLCDTFGRDVANWSADLVVNHHVKIDVLEKAGLKPLTVAFFQRLDARFVDNLSTTEYAQLFTSTSSTGLQDWIKVHSDDANEGVVIVLDGSMSPGDIKQLFGKILGTSTSERVEQEVARVVEAVIAEMAQIGKENSRGWSSSESDEFIAQSKRQSEMAWYEKLHQLETRCRSEERVATLSRPSRRHPLHLGRVRHTKVHMWFGVDTSGSMGSRQLSLIQPELDSIVDRGESEITLIHCDAEIKKQHKFERGDKLEQFFGRGGTDFSPFLLRLHETEMDEWPDFAVFYTDGYGCISQYVNEISNRFGADRWASFSSTYHDCTPEGVKMLWLLAPNTTPADRFREIIPFGEISALPEDSGVS